MAIVMSQKRVIWQSDWNFMGKNVGYGINFDNY